jgi:hypothetical protein
MSASAKMAWLKLAYRLIQYPRHTIDKELKVLWPVQAAKKMAEEVLWCWAVTVARFGYGVQYDHKQQLQAVCDKYLSLVFEYHMVVWHAPCCGVILQRLRR